MMNIRPMILAFLFAVSLDGTVTADPLYYSVTSIAAGTTSVLLNNEGQYVVPAYGSAFLINGSGPNAGQVAQITIPGATSVNPTGLNDLGQVVGGYTVSGATYPFLYSNGQVTTLSGFIGSPAPQFTSIEPQAPNLVISNSGEIAGATLAFQGGYVGSNLLIDNQGVTTNEGLPIRSPDSSGYVPPPVISIEGINSSGQVLANSGGAVIFSNGSYTSLTTSQGVSGANATAINNQGLAVGIIYSSFTAGVYHNGAWTSLGTLGGLSSGALAVNDSGAVVGWSNIAGGANMWHAFLDQNGTMTDLNSLLPPSFQGITLFSATSINDLGQIIAVGGTSLGGPFQDYLLTPPGETALVGVTTLPEPSTMTFFGLIGSAMCLRHFARRARARREVADCAGRGEATDNR